MPCKPFPMLGGPGETCSSSQPVPPGPPSIENGAHGTEKLQIQNSSTVSEDIA